MIQSHIFEIVAKDYGRLQRFRFICIYILTAEKNMKTTKRLNNNVSSLTGDL